MGETAYTQARRTDESGTLRKKEHLTSQTYPTVFEVHYGIQQKLTVIIRLFPNTCVHSIGTHIVLNYIAFRINDYCNKCIREQVQLSPN